MSASEPTGRRVEQAEGVTAAERYLGRLCRRSFLSLWSYPGVYRDQMARGQGKEVCDLLVVFRDHILIFSDKNCRFPDSGNLARDWRRWFLRAVMKSAEQVWGAERWIRSHPDRLFLDRACTKRFPIDLPDPATAKYHRVVVAHGASSRCKSHYGASGSFALSSRFIGGMHSSDRAQVTPFAIGDVDPDKGFIHVLDEGSLGAVLRELDSRSQSRACRR
jgi:hypothetical protein